MSRDMLAEQLNRAVADGVAPAISLLLWQQGRPVLSLCAGAAGPNTVFDLASLTKPLATALLCLDLDQAGLLPWSAALGEIWGDAVPEEKRGITVLQLLSHSSGFPAYQPYYQALEKLDPIMRPGLLRSMLMNEPLAHRPGERAVYSDLGFMLLGLLARHVTREDLPRLVARLYGKLGVGQAPEFFPLDQAPPVDLSLVAPCGPLPGRPVIHGQVEDENCFVLGGVAGHAGLFGPPAAAAAVMSAVCRCLSGDGPWPAEQTARLFAPDAATPQSSRTPGFDTPTPPLSAAGNNPPPGVVGHTGFTGVSLWWRPQENSGVVLFTNRVAHGRDNEKIKPFRTQISDLAWKELQST